MKCSYATKIIILIFFFFLTLNINAKEFDSNSFNGEIFRGVIQDSFFQFNYLHSQKEFLFTEHNLEEFFLKSFTETSYQGVIKTENFGRFSYITEKDTIYWVSEKSTKIGEGSLNMNDFLAFNHPELFTEGPDKIACGGLCIGAIGIGIGAVCSWIQSDCTTRCNQLTCPTGSTKVCISSCLSMSCGVACDHMDPDSLGGFTGPWANGAWNSTNIQWEQFVSQFEDDDNSVSLPPIGN